MSISRRKHLRRLASERLQRWAHCTLARTLYSPTRSLTNGSPVRSSTVALVGVQIRARPQGCARRNAMAPLSRSNLSPLDDSDPHQAPTLRLIRAAAALEPDEPTDLRDRASTLLPPPPGPADLEREHSDIIALDGYALTSGDDEVDPYLRRLAEEHAMLRDADKRDTERCPPSFIDEDKVEYACFSRSTSPPPPPGDDEPR